MRRLIVSMSQEKLGEKLGISFQQIQKYEKGKNRVGSGRLYEIARILGVDVGFFFDQFETAQELSEGEKAQYEVNIASTQEGVKLLRCFSNIQNREVRRRLLDLIEALGNSSGEGNLDPYAASEKMSC